MQQGALSVQKTQKQHVEIHKQNSLFVFETVSYCIAQAALELPDDFKLLILLPQPPKYWITDMHHHTQPSLFKQNFNQHFLYLVSLSSCCNIRLL
jgi:hypothetical protein